MSGDEAGGGNHSYAGCDGGVECFLQHCFTNLGVGYFIVIALGFLILVSAILLASYVCGRSARHQQQPSPLPEGVSLPSVVFVAEDDQELGVPGLDSDVIASYPKFIFSKTKGGGFFGEAVCSICLGDYKDGEVMRMLPDCRHFFHLGCVDSWLRLKASCPICRTSPMPTPISTPLSELVRLFHYPVNHGR